MHSLKRLLEFLQDAATCILTVPIIIIGILAVIVILLLTIPLSPILIYKDIREKKENAEVNSHEETEESS